MVMSSSSCVASRNEFTAAGGPKRPSGAPLVGEGEIRGLGLWSVARAVAQKGSTLILDMTELTTAAKAIEMVHLADALSASPTRRACAIHVNKCWPL